MQFTRNKSTLEKTNPESGPHFQVHKGTVITTSAVPIEPKTERDPQNESDSSDDYSSVRSKSILSSQSAK